MSRRAGEQITALSRPRGPGTGTEGSGYQDGSARLNRMGQRVYIPRYSSIYLYKSKSLPKHPTASRYKPDLFSRTTIAHTHTLLVTSQPDTPNHNNSKAHHHYPSPPVFCSRSPKMRLPYTCLVN